MVTDAVVWPDLWEPPAYVMPVFTASSRKFTGRIGQVIEARPNAADPGLNSYIVQFGEATVPLYQKKLVRVPMIVVGDGVGAELMAAYHLIGTKQGCFRLVHIHAGSRHHAGGKSRIGTVVGVVPHQEDRRKDQIEVQFWGHHENVFYHRWELQPVIPKGSYDVF